MCFDLFGKNKKKLPYHCDRDNISNKEASEKEIFEWWNQEFGLLFADTSEILYI